MLVTPDGIPEKGELRMKEIALASINSFGISPKADFELPSEQLITLTYGQLQDLIIGAIEKAIQPLQEEVAQLREEIAQDRQEIAALCAQVHSLENLQESEISRVCVDIAQDRRRLSALEKIEPQPMQKDRGEILRALLAANGGKMVAKDARQKMHLSKNRFSELLKICDYVETKPLHSDRRKNIIILKSELVPRN